jgi:hypothetical protein
MVRLFVLNHEWAMDQPSPLWTALRSWTQCQRGQDGRKLRRVTSSRRGPLRHGS